MTSIRFLTQDKLDSIHHAAMEVLEKTGVQIKHEAALSLLEKNGCLVKSQQVLIPTHLVEESIKKVPASFDLYNRDGEKSIEVGFDSVTFNPGSSAVYFKDRKTRKTRKGTSQDCIELVQLVENLQHIGAQSTALVPSDVPENLSGLYRLYIVLKYGVKPVITGAFMRNGVSNMRRLLEVIAGGLDELIRKPRAVFDCCPLSPLTWDDTAMQHLMDCASSGIPAEIVPAPLMGATGPITIQGTLIQSCVEILSGLVVAQLVNPGNPLIFGCATGSFDMKYATPRFSSAEAVLAACASSEIGKYLGLPTHAYLGTSDAKTEDMQSGYETGVGLVLGALSEVNVVSGPGMLAQLNCQSLEKLVIDNELCGSALRFSRCIDFNDVTIVTELISKVSSGGNYLGQKHTSKKMRSEHFMPSEVIDRLTEDSWVQSGSKDISDRAGRIVDSILRDNTPDYPEKLDEFERTFEDLKKEIGKN